jgi:protein SCO1/2
MEVLCGSLSLAPSAGFGTYARMRSSLFALILAAGLSACGQAIDLVEPPPPAFSGGDQASCLSRAYPEIGGPVSLMASTGARVTEADFKGRPTIVFFGFTYCPDVCPMTLTTLAAAYRKLPEGIMPPRTLLISVDPARDTPGAMTTYLSNQAFPEDSLGLTGTDAEIRAAADAFMADYARVEQPESTAGYVMDHTSLMYLMDADWQLKTFFTHEDTPETIAACLEKVLK